METLARKFNKSALRRAKRLAQRRPHVGRRINHFKAAQEMVEKIKAALGMSNEVEKRLAMAQIKPYRSRGKGRGTPSKQFGNKGGRYLPHQGVRECARRRGEAGWRARAPSSHT